MRHRAPSIFLAFLIGSVLTEAQWLNHPTPGTPRTKDGKPNLKAPAPRTADGKPDLSGVWMPEPAPLEELAKMIPGHVDGAQTLGEAKPSRYFMNALSDFKPGEIVLTPAAEALFKERGDSFRQGSSNLLLPTVRGPHRRRRVDSKKNRPAARTDPHALRGAAHIIPIFREGGPS